MPVESDAELREILGLQRIAVVGCSTTPGKDAHEIPRYMLDHGYEVIPVNPYADEIFGRTAYDSLRDVPEPGAGDGNGTRRGAGNGTGAGDGTASEAGAGGVDIVDVFRPGEEVAGIVDDALRREDVKVVWTQLGIRDDDAARRVESAGRTMVQDRCLKVEHRRLMG